MHSISKTFAMVALALAATVSADLAQAQRHGPPGHGGGHGGGRHGGGPMIHPIAPQPHQAIYENLLVPEEDATPGIVGALNLQKSVGGLVCTKTIGGGHPRFRVARYNCEFYGRRRNDQRIYNALGVMPVRVHSRRVGSGVVDEKRVANLVCRSERPLRPHSRATYGCLLN